jgi:hypothetical protein
LSSRATVSFLRRALLHGVNVLCTDYTKQFPFDDFNVIDIKVRMKILIYIRVMYSNLSVSPTCTL